MNFSYSFIGNEVLSFHIQLKIVLTPIEALNTCKQALRIASCSTGLEKIGFRIVVPETPKHQRIVGRNKI